MLVHSKAFPAAADSRGAAPPNVMIVRPAAMTTRAVPISHRSPRLSPPQPIMTSSHQEGSAFWGMVMQTPAS